MKILQTIRSYRLISVQSDPYLFNPGVISTFVTAILLYIMLSLGTWQLNKAEFRDTLQQKITQRKNLSPMDLNELPESSDDRRYMPVLLNGKFDSRHNFLLDNRTVNGQVGYQVFTPVRLTDGKAVLISRGFIALGESREQLPDVPSPDGEVTLKGVLDIQPTRALLLAEGVHQNSSWPVVLQYVDLSEISQILDYELYDMVLWLNKDEAGSLLYNLPVLNLNAAKNRGYAFQWFAMSIALIVIYFVVNTRNINNKP